MTTKYLPSQWQDSNKRSFSQAEKERSTANHLRAECARLCEEIDASTKRTQENNAHKFSQRINDINFWRKELATTLHENSHETVLLTERKYKLEEFLKATQFLLEVANNCLAYRENRVAIDLVRDDVEIHLNKEVELIHKVQDLLQKALDRSVEQIRLLKSCKYKLEKDLTDKLVALDIDGTCAGLSVDSQLGNGMVSGPDSAEIKATHVTPDQWASFSNENILKAEKERDASSSLRGVIDGTLDQTKQDIEQQRAKVNLEFSKRIQEIIDAKENLEKHLEQVVKEIGNMEDCINYLKDTISSKTSPMMLATTRLDLRSHRPNPELIRDPIQYGLIDEVGEINVSVEQLLGTLSESERTLKALIRSQLTLGEDIQVKTKSLLIDQDQCMALRQQLNASS